MIRPDLLVEERPKLFPKGIEVPSGHVLLYRMARSPKEVRAIIDGSIKEVPGFGLETSKQVNPGLITHTTKMVGKYNKAVKEGKIAVFATPLPTVLKYYIQNRLPRVWKQEWFGKKLPVTTFGADPLDRAAWAPKGSARVSLGGMLFAFVVPKEALIYVSSRAEALFQTIERGMVRPLSGDAVEWVDTEVIFDAKQIKKIYHVSMKKVLSLIDKWKEVEAEHLPPSLRGSGISTKMMGKHIRDPELFAQRIRDIHLLRPELTKSLGRPFVETPLVISPTLSVMSGDRVLLVHGATAVLTGVREIPDSARSHLFGMEMGATHRFTVKSLKMTDEFKRFFITDVARFYLSNPEIRSRLQPSVDASRAPATIEARKYIDKHLADLGPDATSNAHAPFESGTRLTVWDVAVEKAIVYLQSTTNNLPNTLIVRVMKKGEKSRRNP